jgi:hypothetical protein
MQGLARQRVHSDIYRAIPRTRFGDASAQMLVAR